MKRRTLLGLMAVPVVTILTGAAALTGAHAFAQGPGGPGMHGRMMKRSEERRVGKECRL